MVRGEEKQCTCVNEEGRNDNQVSANERERKRERDRESDKQTDYLVLYCWHLQKTKMS